LPRHNRCLPRLGGLQRFFPEIKAQPGLSGTLVRAVTFETAIRKKGFDVAVEIQLPPGTSQRTSARHPYDAGDGIS
jgi:hypothetical protein